ncbi:MAG: hypothetical protein R2836_05795 [Chitinophagales bacterium]
MGSKCASCSKINDKVEFKISGGYMQGHDFEYYDPREPTWGDKLFWNC